MATEDDEFNALLGVKPKPKAPLTNAAGESPVEWRAAGAARGLDPSVARFAAALAQAGFGDLPITSGYRDPKANARAGGAKGSQHMLGRALDINVAGLTDEQKAQVLDIAVRAGVKGVGIYPGGRILHLDSRVGDPATWGAGANAYRGVPVGAQPGWAQGALKGMMQGLPPEAPKPVAAPAPAPKGPSQEDQDFDALLGIRKQANPPPVLDFRTLPQNDPRRLELFKTAAVNGESDAAFPGVVWIEGQGYDLQTGAPVGEKPQEIPWGAVESGVHGLTLGFLPKMAGKVAGAISGRPEAGERLEEELVEGRRRYQARQPDTSMIAELGGSVFPGIGAGAALNAGLRTGGPVGRFLAGETAGSGFGKVASEAVSGAIQGAQGNAITANLQDNRDVTIPELAAEGAVGGGIVGTLTGRVRAGAPSKIIPNRMMGEAGEDAAALTNGRLDVNQLAPHRGTPSNALDQMRTVTRKLAERFGADRVMDDMGVDGFTEPVWQETQKRLSDQYKSIFQQMLPIQDFDRPLGTKLTDIWNNARVMAPADRDALGRTFQAIQMTRGARGIEPEALQSLLKWEGPIGELKRSSDGNVRRVAADVHRAVESFMARNVRDANGNPAPELIRQYVALNKQWATMKNLEPAVLDAIVAQKGIGYIDPAKLGQLERNATKNARVKDPVLRQGMRAAPALPTRKDLDNIPASRVIRHGLGGGVIGGLGGAMAGGVMEALPALVTQIGQWGPKAAMYAAAGAAALGGRQAVKNKLATSPKTVRQVLDNARTGTAPSSSRAINRLAAPAGHAYKRKWEKEEQK